MRGILSALACVGVLVGAVAHAQDGPPDAELVRSRLSLTLPAYWEISSFETSDPVNYGNDVEPRWKRRFTAKLELQKDTYRQDAAEEGGPKRRFTAWQRPPSTPAGRSPSPRKTSRW